MPTYLAEDTTVSQEVKLQTGRVWASVESLKINVADFKYDIGGKRGSLVAARIAESIVASIRGASGYIWPMQPRNIAPLRVFLLIVTKTPDFSLKAGGMSVIERRFLASSRIRIASLAIRTRNSPSAWLNTIIALHLFVHQFPLRFLMNKKWLKKREGF